MIEAEARALGLATATRTFLLALSERPEHEQLLDRAIAAHRGSPLAAGDVGYGIVVGAFDDAADAIAAALAAHGEGDGLAAVRMAMHTGEVVLPAVDASPTLDRGLALLAIVLGGQLVLSGTTARSLADRLPHDAELVDRGVHHLHDLGRPEQVWQLVSGERTSRLSPLRSLATCRHNLPTQLTPLIGRRSDIHDVGRLVGEERLVTITGPGGIGKTRLAIAVAAATMQRFPGGVWWVELAAVRTGDGAARAALTMLGAAEGPDIPAAMQLAAALGDEASLLVLDNCEHLVEDCAELVAGVLAANTTATVLATSREPLAVPGEVTWRVPSLDPPQRDGPLDEVGLYRSPAARLFVDRALRAQPTLVLDADGTRAVAQICHRLDGVPLAIELAAARCRHLHTSQISRELDDRFRLLTGGSRMTVARHQTMAASIQWSHDRLDEVEQIVFRRLGVFVGPFPLEAAQTVVAAAGDVDADQVSEAITWLVDKSMVVAEVGVHKEPRYRLLETLRAFAVERAAEAGELDDLRDRNARWWASWLDEHFHELHTDAMLDRVDEAHGNLVAALAWSVRDPELGLFLLTRALRSWWVLARAGDAMTAIDQLLTPENRERHTQAWVEAAGFGAGLMMMFRSPAQAVELLKVAGPAAASVGDEFQLAFIGWMNFELHQADRVRELASQRGDRFLEAMAATGQGANFVNDDPQHASDYFRSARRITSTEGSSYLTNFVDSVDARAARDVGDLARSIALGRELAASRAALTVNEGLWILSSTGLLAMDEDAIRLGIDTGERRLPRLPESKAQLEQARARLRALTRGDRAVAPSDLEISPWGNGSLWFVCREAIDAGDRERAISVARAKASAGPFGQAVLAVIEGAVSGDEDRWHEALRLAVEKGLRPIAVDALEGLAVAAARREHWTDCLRLFAAADRLRDETGYRWRFRFERKVVEPARLAAVAALGTDAEQAAAASALEWHEAAAYAARARGRRQRPRHGWDSLTPTELQVAELVAEGHSNPQIAQRLLMGRATVKSHLEHVFTKLGVRSRAELAAVVVRQREP